MKIIAIAVQSLDGCITRGDEPGTAFASNEDQEFFSNTLQQSSLVIMGRNTYTASRNRIRANLDAHLLRVVLTHNPDRFAQDSVPGQLEFTRQAPPDLIRELENRGFTFLLLVGGTAIFKSFAELDLVDEWWITIEPLLFGAGKRLVNCQRPVQLHLLDCSQLNPNTLLLKYSRLQ